MCYPHDMRETHRESIRAKPPCFLNRFGADFLYAEIINMDKKRLLQHDLPPVADLTVNVAYIYPRGAKKRLNGRFMRG